MACNGNIPDQNYIVADRLDSDANIIWNTSIALDPGIGGDHMIKPTSDEGFIVLGAKGCVWIDDAPESGLCIFKTDPDGNYEY